MSLVVEIPNYMHKKIYLLSMMFLISFLSMQAQITLRFADQDVRCQESVSFPVVVENFVDIRGIQFSINWDQTSLEYVSSANVGLAPNPSINVDSIADGKLGLSWFASAPITLQDGDTLLMLTLRVANGDLSNMPLSFSNDFVPIEVTQIVNSRPTIIAPNLENGTITLIDTTPPSITCPAGQTVVNTGGNAAVVINGLSPTNVMDNCGSIDSILYELSGATTGSGLDDASGTAFEVGTTTITYTAKDTKGNAATCMMEVVVSSAGAVNTLGLGLNAITASCTDTVIMPVSVSDFDSITNLGFSLGWDATTFSFVAISDFAIASMSSADVDATQAATGNITVAWADAMPQTLTNQATLFNLKLVPTTVVNNAPITIANGSAAKNNAAIPVSITGQGTITANANNFQITCPANVSMQIPAGQAQASVPNLSLGMVAGNCGNTTITYTLAGATTGGGANDASELMFNVGTTTVTYTVENAVGQQVTCAFTVDVTSQAATNFTLIAESRDAACDDNDITIDINVAAFDNISGTEFSVNWDPAILSYVASDNKLFTNGSFGPIDNTNGRINYSWFDSSSDGQTLADGTTLFTMHFTSSGGGMSTIEFSDNPNTIEITQRDNGAPVIVDRDSIVLMAGKVTIIDTIPPTITCPNDVVIDIALGENGAVVNNIDFSNPSDNCGVDSVYYTLTGATIGSGEGSASGLTFQAGMTTVTYTVLDQSGLEGTCQFQVNINAPNAITVTPMVEDAACGAELYRVDLLVDSFTNAAALQFTFEWDPTILEYDSRGNFGLPEFDAGDFNGDFLQDGRIAFAWADDGSVGETLPSGAILFSLFFKVNGAVGSGTSFLFTDVIAEREASIRLSGTPIIVPFIGNSTQINVVDTEAPILMAGLPDTLYRFVIDTCGVFRDWNVPTFMDLCTNNLTLTVSPPEGTFYEVGDHVITYTASDDSGNSMTESTLLIVRDTTAPTLVNCPVDMMLTVDANCQAVATWTEPNAVDNCSDAIIIVSSTHSPGDIFTETTTVTYTAEDNFGNRSTCSFVVTLDGISPIVFNNFPGNIISNEMPEGTCGVVLGWLEPTISGGCNSNSTDSIVLTSTHPPGALFPVGLTTVTYTATNVTTGQVIEQSFTIRVNRSLDPLTLCPQDIEIQADGTVMNDPLGFINSVRTDTCGSYIITYNNIQVQNDCGIIRQQVSGPISGSEFTFGTEQMEFWVIDTINQDTFKCPFQIKINETRDLEATTLDNPTCAGSDLRLSVNELIGGTYQWSGPGGFIANIQAPTIPNAMTQNSGEYIVKVISTNGCTIKDSIMVGILSGPEVSAMGDGLSCSAGGDTIRLFATVTNGIPVQNYNWTGPNGFSTDVQNPMIPNATTSNAGLYIVTGTSSNGCADMDTVVIGPAGMIIPEIVKDIITDTICMNTFVTLTGTAYDGIVIYNWIAGTDAGLPTNVDTNVIIVTPTIAGTYTYAYTASLDGNCVSDTARITLVVRNGTGEVTLASNGPFDCADPSSTINLTATGGTNVETYAWTGPNNYTSSDQNPIIPIVNEAAGMYFLTATSPEGCTFTDSISVTISTQGAAPIITASPGVINAGNLNACEGDALTLTGEIIPDAIYVWTGPNGFASTDSAITIPNVMANDAGVYQLRVTVNGCTTPTANVLLNLLTDPLANNDSVNVIRNQALMFNVTDNDDLLPGAAFIVNLISGADNGTLVNNNDGTFNYTPDNNFVGMDQIAYEICYTDCPDLCDMAIMTIRTEFPSDPCVVPTFISPNNDGFNDAFIISCVPTVPKVGSELIIFNEWGSEVFRESPYQNNWQGTYNGQDLPDGTYYYIFKEDNDDNDPKKGYVTIFR